MIQRPDNNRELNSTDVEERTLYPDKATKCSTRGFRLNLLTL